MLQKLLFFYITLYFFSQKSLAVMKLSYTPVLKLFKLSLFLCFLASSLINLIFEKRILPNILVYKKGIYFEVTIDKQNYLPSDSPGGVEMTAKAGKIKVSSTLESRLELIASQVLNVFDSNFLKF